MHTPLYINSLRILADLRVCLKKNQTKTKTKLKTTFTSLFVRKHHKSALSEVPPTLNGHNIDTSNKTDCNPVTTSSFSTPNMSNNKRTNINLVRNNCQPGTNFDFPVKKYAGKNRIVQRKFAESIWRACVHPFKSRNLLYILCAIWSDNLGTLAYKVCIIESGTTQQINTDARALSFTLRSWRDHWHFRSQTSKKNEIRINFCE